MTKYCIVTSDSSKIVSTFAGPQVPGTYTNYVELEDTDPLVEAWDTAQANKLARASIVTSATDALSNSDTTILRCYENNIPVPTEWANYRQALRNIISYVDMTSISLPNQPPYPQGT